MKVKKFCTFEAVDALSKVLAISQTVLCYFFVVDLSRKVRPNLVQNVFPEIGNWDEPISFHA